MVAVARHQHDDAPIVYVLQVHCGCGVALASEERVSGPERASVDRSEDPFSRGEVDVGFLCAPTYLRLREREHPPAELLGVAPVFVDQRARGKPVYFCDVIVRRDSQPGRFGT